LLTRILGLFGPAAATALEDLPYEARGILSGLFEQGYATGYLLAAIFYRALVPTTTHGWRSLFWFGSVPPIFIMIFRYYLPETNAFLVQRAEREVRHQITQEELVANSTIAATSAVGPDATLAAAPKTHGMKAFIKESQKAFADNVSFGHNQFSILSF
jgi:SHS family lactate transporter-like MFS transporter